MFITIGGMGTIVAVLMVFVFLLYVALPLFLPSTISHPHLSEQSSTEIPLLFGLDEHGLYTWKLHSQGRFLLSRAENGEVIAEQECVAAGKKILAVSWSPESTDDSAWSTDLALGLNDGSLALGKIQATKTFKQAADLPAEIRDLPPGGSRLFEGGIIEHTQQGLYRWQTLTTTFSPALSLFDSPVADVDYRAAPQSSLVAAISQQGEVVLAEVITRENILTGEIDSELTKKTIPLPKDITTPPWKARLLGRGTDLVLIWKDGRLVRMNELWSEKPQEVERLHLCSGQAELTAVLLLQGRYSLLVGDSRGRLVDWYMARDDDNNGQPAMLVKGHKLPAMQGEVTALARSTNLRMVVAGSSTGEVATYHITTARRLTSNPAFPQQKIEAIALSPDDHKIVALSGEHSWEADFEPQHPEATFASLLAPVRYEGYKSPKHIWQSTAGTTEPEPKFGMVPLIFGTLKATFYSMLFGAPIALLAAIYTSEFVDTRYKSQVKSTLEMMAVIPSVVLGYLAGMVFAPFAERILPVLLASFMVVPFMFLLGAQLWQILPQKLALHMTRWRLPILAATFLSGIACSIYAGPYTESLLFAGDLKKWLNHETGESTGGLFLLLLPICMVVMALLVTTYLNPRMRHSFGNLPRMGFAFMHLAKFLLAVFVAGAFAYVLASLFAKIGVDARGGLFDSYVQRNALVVGFVMGFAIIPIVYTVSEDALSTVPQHLRSASLGCGATPWQTTWRVVIPTAASGLFSAVMIGFGRAVGETMIMLMATGNVPIMEVNLFNGFRSLSANIAEELPEAAQWGTHFRLLFFTGLILLALTFIINTLAESVRISFRRRARQL